MSFWLLDEKLWKRERGTGAYRKGNRITGGENKMPQAADGLMKRRQTHGWIKGFPGLYLTAPWP